MGMFTGHTSWHAPHSDEAFGRSANSGNFSPASNGDSTAQAKHLCDAVKDSKITLYTIGFQVSAAAHAMMTTCATSSGHYFDAENGSELVAVFNAIGKSIRTIWLSS